MSNNAAETVIGAVVLSVAVGFMIFAARSADISTASTYELTAQFRKADGVNVGGDVRIAGVKVGTVRSMTLNPDSFQAEVRMALRRDVMVPDDSAATIASDGLLGGAHIAIQPGGSEFMIEPGGAFTITQGSVNLLDLVGRAITGGGE